MTEHAPSAFAALLEALRDRFEANPDRHPGVTWTEVAARVESQPERLAVLARMEETGGEPDVLGGPLEDGSFVFVDCSPESPAGRRSLCYDPEALAGRKKNPPRGSAVGMAESMGLELLSEEAYAELQQHGDFDTKTSSWLRTPPAVRDLGGAIFGDRRFGRVFTYHNGADSYYAARGFRCRLRV